jgi:hypothetical protein
VAIRFGVSSTVKNRLPRYSNFWDGTAVFSPFTASGSYDALATYTVPSGGIASVTFAGIPTGGQYSHLQLRIAATANASNRICIAYNSDTNTSNYNSHYLEGNGSVAYAGNVTGVVGNTFYTTGSTYPFVSIVDILDYANTSKYKVQRALSGDDTNGGGKVSFYSSLWLNTNAINSLNITVTSSSFKEYSQFALYGIRG